LAAVLVAYGIGRRAIGTNAGQLLPLLWVGVFPILAYAPYNLQRRLPEGVWAAWVLLALIGWRVFRADHPRAASRLGPLALSVSLISSALILLGALQVAAQPSAPVFRPTDEIRAMLTIADHVERDAVVVSSYASGNALPAWAPVRVVIGHGPESVNRAQLEPNVKALYQAKLDDEETCAFFMETGADIVWYGPEERSWGDFPERSNRLTLLHEEGEYAFYKVDCPPNTYP
jgi:hypothetical protein